ncbi:hypothetical protein N2152v2_009555 [Parachlorella kessleri]
MGLSAYATVALPSAYLGGPTAPPWALSRRLGCIDQMYVDPYRLQVSTLYLRRELLGMLEPFRRSSAAGSDRVGLGSLVQIGDVVLVHDEQALNEPPGDESAGMVKLVGASVKTEDGVPLGKVRDYVFNPDNGAITTIVYDAFGLPVIPKGLLTIYQLGYQEIMSVGPTEVIVRRGAELRALKERGGQMEEFVESGAALLASIFTSSGQAAMRALDASVGQSELGSREDMAYAEWYLAHGQEWERLYGQKVQPPSQAALAELQKQQQRQLPPQQRRQQTPPPQRGAPRALPPAQSQSYDQVLQLQEAQRAAAGQPWASQVQPAREAVPAGAAGWGGSNGTAAAAARPLARTATQPPLQPPAQPWPEQWQQGAASPQGLGAAQSQGRQPQVPAAQPASPQYSMPPPQQQQPRPPGQPARPAANPAYAQQAAWGYPPAQQPPAAGAQQAQQAPPVAGPPAGPAAVEPDAVVVAGGGFQPGVGRAPVQQAEFSATPQARRTQAPQQYPQAPPPLPQQQW